MSVVPWIDRFDAKVIELSLGGRIRSGGFGDHAVIDCPVQYRKEINLLVTGVSDRFATTRFEKLTVQKQQQELITDLKND